MEFLDRVKKFKERYYNLIYSFQDEEFDGLSEEEIEGIYRFMKTDETNTSLYFHDSSNENIYYKFKTKVIYKYHSKYKNIVDGMEGNNEQILDD